MRKKEYRFIFGKATANLDEKCIEFIRLDIKNPNIDEIIVISDNKHKRELELNIKKESIIDPNLKLNITTLEDLIKREHAVNGDKRISLISDEQVLAIMSHIIYLNKDSFTLYKDISTGLIKRFISTIELLKKHNISPDDINETLIKDNTLLHKLSDIKLIYSEYEKYKGDKYLDKYDQINYYTKLIKKDTTTKNIYLYKLIDINTNEFNLIKSIKKELLTIIIDTDRIDRCPGDESGHFYKMDLYIEKILNEFKIEKDTIESIYIDTDSYNNKELTHLSNELYKYPHQVLNIKTENIFLTEHESITDEVEYTINILQSLNAKNHNVSIAVTNLEDYENVLKRAFLKNKIPFNMDKTIQLNTQSIHKILNILLDLKERLTLSGFIKLLKTNYFDLKEEDVYKLERYLIQKELLNETTFDCISEDDLLGLSNYKSITELFNTIKEFLLSLDKPQTLKEYLRGILNLLDTTNVLVKIQEEITDERKLNEYSITELAWEDLISKFNLYSKMIPEEQIELEELLLILQTILDASISIKSKETNGINIVNIDSLQNCDIAFVLGVNKGLIQNVTNNTLLTDNDILNLNEFKLLIGEDYITKTLETQYDIYSLLTNAKKKLFISYSTKGLDLSKREKAPFINRLNAIFKEMNHDGTSCNIVEHNVPRYTIRNLIDFMNEIKDPQEFSNSIERIEQLNSNICLNELEAIAKATKYTNKALCTNKHNLQELYYSDFLSVSKLEKYAKCPFSYFLEYGLKLKKEESVTLQAKHIGIALHSIIEEFDKVIRNKCNNNWSEISDDFIKIETENIISKLEKREVMKPFYKTESSTYYLKRMRELAISSIKAIKSHIGYSFFEIVGHEINFNDFGAYPAIQIKLHNGKILKLQGQIDRLDILKNNTESFIRIVDYKTGNTSLDFTEIAHGTQLQLLTYLDAILSNNDNLKPAGIFYFKVDDPYIKAIPTVSDVYISESRQKEMKLNGLFTSNEDVIKTMDKGIFDGEYNTSVNIKARFKTDGTLSKSTPGIEDEDLNVLKEFTKRKIEDLATNMLVDCDITIKPTKKKSIISCTYCHYKDVCHFDETLDINKFNVLKEVTKDELLKLAYKKVGVVNE